MKIMIATPSFDGKVEAAYAYSLINSVRLLEQHKATVFPIFVTHDSLLFRARNDIFKMAYESKVEMLIMVDSDQVWPAETMAEAIKHAIHEKTIVGVPIRKKTSTEAYNVVYKRNFVEAKNHSLYKERGLLDVDGIGTGFMVIPMNIINDVYNMSSEYENEGSISRMVFETIIDKDGYLLGEDIAFCEKCKALGYSILAFPAPIGHIDSKITYSSSFIDYLSRIFPKQ